MVQLRGDMLALLDRTVSAVVDACLKLAEVACIAMCRKYHFTCVKCEYGYRRGDIKVMLVVESVYLFYECLL